MSTGYPEEIAPHADGTICERATTTHDCPLSHDYRPAGTYSRNDRAELTTALETIAASKSPTARISNAREAHLLNARIARRILRDLIERQDEFVRRDAEHTDANYIAWERDITTITDLNRRALRK